MVIVLIIVSSSLLWECSPLLQNAFVGSVDCSLSLSLSLFCVVVVILLSSYAHFPPSRESQ